MTKLERLEKELKIAEAKLDAERLAYRKAKACLKHAKIEAGIIKPDEAVMRFVAEVREKIELFKSDTVRSVLTAVCDTLNRTNTSALLELDDVYFKYEQSR